MTDSRAVAAEASAAGQDEATCDGDSGADQRNADVNDRGQEEASSVAKEEVKDLVVSDKCSDSGKRKTDVDALAKGIASVLGPVMNNFDGGVEGVLKSQSVLASSIDRLTRELDKLLEDVPHPYATHHATRLSGIRKRVITLNTSLRIIQKRMEMIQRLLAGYALKASTSSQASSKLQSTSNDVVPMEVSPHEVSSFSADSRHNYQPTKVEDLEISNLPGNILLGGLQGASIQEKEEANGDSKDDLVISPQKEVFIEKELGGASIARDEAGEADVEQN